MLETAAKASRHERVVLVVDDDEAIRESLADLLSDEGYRTMTATNGAEALDKLREPGHEPPCVILLDLMMPVMNGQQFYAQKQQDPRLTAIPVVVISADVNLRQKAIPFGGEFLAKPVRIETILETLARLCPDEAEGM
jgi:CheY-like chemotaxis protein